MIIYNKVYNLSLVSTVTLNLRAKY